MIPREGNSESELTEEQRQAATSAANRILILAGAGTGKTRVVVQRVAHLVANGCDPSGIILLTFTLRAGKEMQARLTETLGPTAIRVQASTFHALAYARLSTHGDLLNLPPGWSVASPAQQLELMDRAMQAASRRVSTPRRLLELGALAINTQCRLHQTCSEYAPELLPDLSAIDEIFDAYAAEKSGKGLLDFDDLLLLFKGSLLEPESRMQAWRDTLTHVLVDEYQDTTPLQAELAQLLCANGAHLVAVGDDAQSIYGFRGAQVQNILRFPDVAPTQMHALTRCFRSQGQIVDAAQGLIKNNRAQFNTPLFSEIPAGPSPALVFCAHEAQQSEFVAHRIAAHTQAGLPLSEIAVLFRTHAQGEVVQRALTHAQVPFVVRGGPSLLKLPHIQHALAFLRLLVEPADPRAWVRVLEGLEGVGVTTAQQLANELVEHEHAAQGLRSLASKRTRVQPQLQRLAEVLEDLQRYEHVPGDALVRLIEGPQSTNAGYLQRIRRTESDVSGALAQLRQVADTAVVTRSIREFFAHLALDPSLESDPMSSEAVTLSTVHQAKGLEWSTVFVMGLAEGLFPLRYALSEVGGEQQERRLLYVAMTRAKDALYLCAPGADGRGNPLSPARYLFELPEASTERWSLSG